ncbi:AraC family transcriptional regulator [Clostridium sp. C8-1-8]|uniref:AraC family transcriptional regulator n=1 Tax=Clostridium sp. C8-1-8 TaxID=2698831 RepID=UPI00136E604C|nr:AraC family transcriptional regulator [Clostridium sp. C8-1-8]
MDYYTLIEDSINYIENNLHSVISLKDLSENTYVSPYHFHRIFKALVGDTLMDYVRKRRISDAALRIASTNKSLADIAYEYNSSSQDVFSRAFSRVYGMTPGTFRKLKPEIQLFEKKSLVIRSTIYPSLIDDTHIPKIVIKNSFLVVGMECTVSRAELSLDILTDDKWSDHEIRKMHDDFFGSLQWKVKNKVPTSDCIAAYLRNEDNSLTDLACIEVSSFEDIPENMICRTLPSQKYAVFKFEADKSAEHITPFDLSTLTDYIYGIWLPESNYALAEAASLEIWLPAHNPLNHCEANIYIPIK